MEEGETWAKKKILLSFWQQGSTTLNLGMVAPQIMSNPQANLN